jgi:hypothetical protein
MTPRGSLHSKHAWSRAEWLWHNAFIGSHHHGGNSAAQKRTAAALPNGITTAAGVIIGSWQNA